MLSRQAEPENLESSFKDLIISPDQHQGTRARSKIRVGGTVRGRSGSVDRKRTSGRLAGATR
jgi:hypothetical protein